MRRNVEPLLVRDIASSAEPPVGMRRELHGHRHWLSTFLRCEGVEPPNNAGESALGHAVIRRTLSWGAHSAAAGRFIETMQTEIETCRQQLRSAFEYHSAAIPAHLADHPPPSLLSGV